MTDQASDDCARTREEIAAYLDGELDARARFAFERHVRRCVTCAAPVEEQRRLLRDLNFALNDDPAVKLPADFAQIVTAHARADMRGVRASSEQRRAVWLSAALALVSLALADRASVLQPVGLIARQLMSALGFVWHALFDAGRGLAVIFRLIGGHFIFESHRLSVPIFSLLVVALALLLRLVAAYHRTRIME